MQTIQIIDNDIKTIEQYFGRQAIHTTWDGDEIVGTLRPNTEFSSGFPIIEFDDGGWARTTSTIRIL